MSNDTQRMQDIQNALVAHIQTQLTTDEDFMYVATMLLKHSLVLYKTFLEDEQIKQMLAHVADTLADDLDVNDYTTSNNSGGTTRH
jgi:hypothetical protein